MGVWEQQVDCTFLKFFVLPFLFLKVLNPPNSSLYLQKLSQRWLNSSNFVSHDQEIKSTKIVQRDLYKPEYSCNNAVWEQQFDCTFLKFFVLPFLALKVQNLPNFSLFLHLGHNTL